MNSTFILAGKTQRQAASAGSVRRVPQGCTLRRAWLGLALFGTEYGTADRLSTPSCRHSERAERAARAGVARTGGRQTETCKKELGTLLRCRPIYDYINARFLSACPSGDTTYTLGSSGSGGLERSHLCCLLLLGFLPELC
jgi:hypothetical protein